MFKDMFTLSGRWGRLNRIRYFGYGSLAGLVWLISLVIVLLLAFGGLSALDANNLGGMWGALLLIIPFYLALVWVQICLTVKRLHDLNKSGWWLVGAMAVSFVAGAITGMGDIMALVAIALNVLLLVYGLWLLFWPGTVGDNQYGPDPLDQA
jgi:uncharacterized membrane protein YhaH (DUF805 family)